MNTHPLSIRPFIGAKDFEISSSFYRDLGFEETVLSYDLSVFKISNFAFYLQRYYSKDWVDNTMIFLEVADADSYFKELEKLNLPAKYEGAKLSPVRTWDWGRECYLHDPSGILWHIGTFKK